FEENLRPVTAVDVRIHAFARSVLRIAKAGAGFISASARPNLDGMNRHEGSSLLGVPAGQAGSEGGQLRRFGFRAANQVLEGVRGNGPREAIFKNGRHGTAIEFNLSKAHGWFRGWVSGVRF